MEKLYGNYLGICISNTDPEYRGRVQIFIPHILPALYERWNQSGTDKKIEILGNNLDQALSQEDIEQLKKMLPWAEAAAPVFGNSVAGHYNPQSGNFNQLYGTENEAAGGSVGGAGADVSGGLIDFIKSFEGFSSTPYSDYGQTSIGYGTRAKPGETSITEAEATARLQAEVGEAAAAVNSALANRGISLNSRQVEALTSFTYNAGPGNLAQLLDSEGGRRDWGTISQAMTLYNKAGGNTLAGLTRRRGAEVAFGNSPGVDLNKPESGLYPPSSNPAQPSPFLSVEPQPYLSLEPSQEAILNQVAETVGSGTLPGSGLPAPGTGGGGGSGRAFNFGNATSTAGSGKLYTAKPGGGYSNTYCLRGTVNVAGYITGNTDWYGATGITYAKNVGQVDTKLTSPAQNGPGKGKVLYGNLGKIQGTNYQPQQGDVAIHQVGGGIAGHAQIFVDGNWHSFIANDNSFQRYLDKSGQQTTVFRLTQDGINAVREQGLCLTEYLGAPYSGPVGPVTSVADVNGFEGQAGMVRNPSSTQPTVTDTTGMPQGLFSVPNPGAMLWVFFREGDPLYPVYFAASYGAQEWGNAYKTASPGAHYPNEGDSTPRNQAIFRPNQSGGLTFTDTITDQKDSRSIRMFHANGGYQEFNIKGCVTYSPNEYFQQVAGNAYNSCLNRENWTQGFHNDVTLGDRIKIVGNVSQEALAIIEEHAQIVKDINKNMLKGG